MTKLSPRSDVLNEEEVGHFWTQGYLRVPDVYASDEVGELAEDLDLLIDRWARSEAWTGPWREALLDADSGGQDRAAFIARPEVLLGGLGAGD